MASYRFCRSDDIPLLVDAYNRCYRPHFPEAPELTVAGFKELIRRYDLWTSSCMVAVEGDTPIAVLFAAKRDHDSLIYCVGVHEDHQRQGHGQHLLTSLSQKLAILGPPILRAELPAGLEAGRALLEASGYTADRIGRSLRREYRPIDVSPAESLLASVTPQDLLAHGAIDVAKPRPWLRCPAAWESYGEQLQGLAVLSDVRVEAYVVFHRERDAGSTELLALGAESSSRLVPLLELLLDRIQRDSRGALEVHGVSTQELPAAALDALGFEETSRTAFYSVTATPA